MDLPLIRQVLVFGRNDRVNTLRYVIPTVCEGAFALQNRAELTHQAKKEKTTARAVFSFL